MAPSVQHFRLDRIPDNLLREPLEFLFADHMRQRKICNAIDAIHLTSEKILLPELAGPIFAYLSEDFPLHVADEECDLFPALRAAADHDNNLRDLIDVLTRNHAIELSMSWDVIVYLKRNLHSSGDADNVSQFSRLLFIFTDCLRRHLVIEDQMLLPFARKCLSRSDLSRIGHSMAQRRKITYPE
jgi:hemerythrin-like domain-containing protein